MVGKKKKHRIIVSVILLLLVVLAFGIYIKVSGRFIRVYGTVLHVEKVYFDDDEKNECSLRNPYYKQIVSALKELSKQETADPGYLSFLEPDFTIHAYNDVRCEVFFGRTAYPVPAVEGYVDTYNYSVLGVRIVKGKTCASYNYKMEVDEALQVRELIWEAEEWEE